VKQVAGLDGENSRPSRLLEVAADVSYLGADLFDHRTAHFHPLWALFDSCEFLTRYFTWILPRLVTLTFPDFLNFFCWNFLLARRVGGRFKYLWLATIFHGLTVECAAYWLPDIDNFWHSQTTIVLLGRRLPIHIMMLCNHPYAYAYAHLLSLCCWLQIPRLSTTLRWPYRASDYLTGLNHLQVIRLQTYNVLTC
jgi:hypothetical protein